MATNPIELTRGATLTVPIAVTLAEGPPRNLAGTTLTLTVKRTSAGGVEVTKAGTITNAADGEAEFAFVPADTRNLTPGRYLYDVWLDLPGGERLQVVEPSAFVLRPSVRTPP